MNKRIETVDDLSPAHAGGGNLDQPVILQRKSRRLGIEYDDIVFYQPKRTRFRAIGERLVCFNHIVGSTG